MAPKISFSFLFLVIALFFAFAFASDHVSLPFSYNGTYGPGKWGSLNPQYAACSSGKLQSPININKKEAVLSKSLKSLSRNYVPSNATLVNNGFNVGVVYQSHGGNLVIDGKNYTLKQMHWHSPSEHQIDGVQFPAELHLVHLADSGEYSVVSILYEYGEPDSFISKIQKSLEELAKEKCGGDEEAHIALGTLDLKLLRKKTRKYFRYVGSLTTPPCTEDVVWNILGKVRTISKEQVEALTAPLDMADKKNCRPLQSLNGRKVELYNEFSD